MFKNTASRWFALFSLFITGAFIIGTRTPSSFVTSVFAQDGQDSSEAETMTLTGHCSIRFTKVDEPDPVRSLANLQYTLKVENIGTAVCLHTKVMENYDSKTVYVSAKPIPEQDGSLLHGLVPPFPVTDHNFWYIGDLNPGQSRTIVINMTTADQLSCTEPLSNQACWWAYISPSQPWTCITEPTSVDCTQTSICGNSIIEATELCDDGLLNGTPNHCNAQCSGITAPHCGNAVIETGEQCDDGNTVDHDGCSAYCVIETPPATCVMDLKKTDDHDPTLPGATLVYQLTLKNIGTADCTGGGVQLKEYYDSRTSFISATPTPTTGNNLWNFGTMHPNDSKLVTITTRVSDTVQNGDVLNNKACFWTREYDRWTCVEEPTTIIIPTHEPICGNGVKEIGEQCDGTDGVGEHQICTSQCTLENVPYCGNGIKEGQEECDGTDGVGPNQLCTAQCQLQSIAKASICGVKFHDKNQSKQQDSGEENLSDWTIQLFKYHPPVRTVNPFKGLINLIIGDDSSAFAQSPTQSVNDCWQYLDNHWTYTCTEGSYDLVATKITTDTGYCFDDLDPATYFVAEIGKVGWTPIQPSCLVNATTTSVFTCNIANLQQLPGGPVCGNGIKETGEQCDGTDGVGSHQRCSSGCTLTTLSYCGDGTKQNPNDDGFAEQCDGTDGVGEHQQCKDTCVLENVPFCGNSIKDGQEECDGVDGVGTNQSCSATCNLVSTIQTGGCSVNCGGGGGGGGGGGSFVPTLSIDKTVDRQIVEAGDEVMYTVIIRNTGNVAGNDLVLDDTLPSGLTYVDGGGQTKQWNLSILGPGSSQTVTYKVKVTDGASTGTYPNKAVARISNGQAVSDTTVIQVERPIILGVQKIETLPKKSIKVLPDTSGYDVSNPLIVMTIVFGSIGLAALLTHRRMKYETYQ